MKALKYGMFLFVTLFAFMAVSCSEENINPLRGDGGGDDDDDDPIIINPPPKQNGTGGDSTNTYSLIP
jgi:hypothetical protein